MKKHDMSRDPIMDNFHIDITSRVKAHFDEALRIAFDNAAGHKASHYMITEKHGMILFWHEENGAIQLPYEMTYEDAVPFVWGWLQKVDYDQYEEQLDHDGDNDKGFRIFNENWGHVGDHHYAFVAIKPAWAWIGK